MLTQPNDMLSRSRAALKPRLKLSVDTRDRLELLVMREFARLTTDEAEPLRKRMGVVTARYCPNCRDSEIVSNDHGDPEIECRKSYGNPFFVRPDDVCPAHRFSGEDA